MSVNLSVVPPDTSRDGFVSWLMGQEWPSTAIPDTSTVQRESQWGPVMGFATLPACPLCASLALDRNVHALWHADLAGLA